MKRSVIIDDIIVWFVVTAQRDDVVYGIVHIIHANLVDVGLEPPVAKTRTQRFRLGSGIMEIPTHVRMYTPINFQIYYKSQFLKKNRKK